MRKTQIPNKGSKQSQKLSCKYRDIDNATVLYHERKYLESRTWDESAENVTDFIPVQVQPEPKKEKESIPLELQIVFPNGIQIICPESVHPSILKLLLNSLPCLP
jgi:hypothetical protein